MLALPPVSHVSYHIIAILLLLQLVVLLINHVDIIHGVLLSVNLVVGVISVHSWHFLVALYILRVRLLSLLVFVALAKLTLFLDHVVHLDLALR